MNGTARHAIAIEEAFKAIDVARDGGFWWCDERADWYPAKLLTGLSADERRALTLSALTECLYENFYRCGEVRPLPPATAGDERPPDPFPRDLLANANEGRGSWQPGWELLATASQDRVRVRRNGLTLLATPDEIRRANGSQVSIRRPKDMYALSPGFHTANLDVPHNPSKAMIRLYWHLLAAGAEEFIRTVTGTCNGAGIGGSLKVVNDRSHYDRCDSAVVYMSTDDFLTNLDLLASMHTRLSPYLLPETPAMTLKLTDGLAVAQDHGGDLSFGQHRCGLLAKAVMQGNNTTEANPSPAHHIREVFANDNVSVDQPYCPIQSIDAFDRIAGQWNSTTTSR